MNNTRLKKQGMVKLSEHLLLAQFIAKKLGITLSDIKEFRDVQEGFDNEGRSYMFHALLSRRREITYPEEKLRDYDENIKRYFERWKRNRMHNISLKYFQYLALLFTEVFFDNYFANPTRFLNEINSWIEEESTKLGSRITYDDIFGDIRKIAYWMATGSGKTMIMHINYWQFMHYKGKHKIDYENVILITPSDEMSNQHLEELRQSGINAILFQGDNTRGYFDVEEENGDLIKVISIHKLKLPEDKRGEGVTVDVSNLSTKNLLFVDEGHKGNRSEDQKWKQIREYLVRDGGFTFEYSATFGQVITDNNNELFREYSQSIIFDYSYKYFYHDGYGKDFHVLNINESSNNYINTIFLANLISFYEQLYIYQENNSLVKEYNIEKPLWIFVGSRVNKEESDIKQVVELLAWYLNEDKNKIIQMIEKILDGTDTGIYDKDGQDVFRRRFPETNFPYLRELYDKKQLKPEDIYKGILERVFYVYDEAKKLYLIDLKAVEGEIGLKAHTDGPYFGVINIGDKEKFLKDLANNNSNRLYREKNDVMKESLFNLINEFDSKINILIGAKKFIEGWNSWRVSSMCLLNVGRSEGPQIIQLFGRGVRLKGKNYSLKRSRFVDDSNNLTYIQPLETLNIYGINAKYLATFKEIIEREDVKVYEEIRLPTYINESYFQDNLKILKPKGKDLFDKEILLIEAKEDIKCTINLSARGETIDPREREALVTTYSVQPQLIPQELLDILDWDRILLTLLEYKYERGWHNIIITKEGLKQIIYQGRYCLLCHPDYLSKKNSFFELQHVTDLVVQILKKYIERFYVYKRNEYERDKYVVEKLTKDDENILKEYRLRVIQELAAQLKKTIEGRKSWQEAVSINGKEFSINFTNHLYQPLLVKNNDDSIITIPIGLNEGEKRFVKDLNDYLNRSHADSKCQCTVYLLRNLTRGKGVGFFKSNTFYPDFILWVLTDRLQYIIFIDPKGLVHYDLDHPKLNLYKYLKKVEETLGDPTIKLDAFIISNTPYEIFLQQRNLDNRTDMKEIEEKNHILFQYLDRNRLNTNYIDRLFELMNINKIERK
ncbi:MAG: DEAD/DEAH box helicase family protein [Candidatus Nitrosocaldaceae archaeon]